MAKSSKKPSTAFLDLGSKDDDDRKSDSEDDDNEKIEIRSEKVEVEEKERLRDIEERDAFSERLQARDDAATKRKMDATTKKMLEEAAKRLKLDKEDRKKVVPKLREESRRVYLEQREKDKLAELEQEVEDEEYIWSDTKLTDYERQRLEQKKRTLEIAKQYKEADQIEKADHYQIPKENEVERKDKYAEDIKEKGPNFEQRKWEEDQVILNNFNYIT